MIIIQADGITVPNLSMKTTRTNGFSVNIQNTVTTPIWHTRNVCTSMNIIRCSGAVASVTKQKVNVPTYGDGSRK